MASSFEILGEGRFWLMTARFAGFPVLVHLPVVVSDWVGVRCSLIFALLYLADLALRLCQGVIYRAKSRFSLILRLISASLVAVLSYVGSNAQEVKFPPEVVHLADVRSSLANSVGLHV